MAVRGDRPEILKLVATCLENGTELISSLKDGRGSTLLHIAVENEFRRVVEVLLELPRRDINVTNNDGCTVLYLASARGYISMVELLLKVPLVDVNISDNRGRTPLLIATVRGHLDTVRVLLRLPNILVNSSDNAGNSPLHVAANRGHIRILKMLLVMPNIDVNAQDNEGHTALYNVVWRSRTYDKLTSDIYVDVLRVLLEVPTIDVSTRSRMGTTLVQAAVWSGHTEFLRMLCKVPNINMGINATDHYGRSALHVCVYFRNENATKILLEVDGIDRSLRDHRGRTPLEVAQERDYKRIAKLLSNEKRNSGILSRLMA